MARASYQHIPNLVLGQRKPKKIKKQTVKGAVFSPSTPYSPPSPISVPREPRPLLKLKLS
jgi:hypothetical protein